MTVNAGGSVVGYDDYYPYGEIMPGRSSVSSADDRYKFTGKERDVQTGYDYFGARYYDSWMGRFLSVDPAAGGFPGVSPYNYVGNNPVNRIDINGEYPACTDCDAIYNEGAQVSNRFGSWEYLGNNQWQNLTYNVQQDAGLLLGMLKGAARGSGTISHDNTRYLNANGTSYPVVDDYVGSTWGHAVDWVENKTNIHPPGLVNSLLKSIITLGGVKEISVIGPRTIYREFAQRIGANFLDVTDEAWTWEKNLKFLQGIVKRGDDVVFAGKFNPDLLDKTSILAREIKYLEGNGYQWTNNYSKMILKK